MQLSVASESNNAVASVLPTLALYVDFCVSSMWTDRISSWHFCSWGSSVFSVCADLLTELCDPLCQSILSLLCLEVCALVCLPYFGLKCMWYRPSGGHGVVIV